MQKIFQAVLTKENRLTFIVIPFDASQVFNIKGKIEVDTMIKGKKIKKSLLPRGGGKYILTFDKALLKKLKVAIGDEFEVTMEKSSVETSKLDDDPIISELYKTVNMKKNSSTGLDTLEAIFTRRSIRKYTGEVVPNSEIEILLKAGSYAPSAENKQPWHFIVIKDIEMLQNITEIQPRSKMILEAGCTILVCGDKDIQKQTGFLIEDCSASIQNILLAAHTIQLGAVWCGIYPVSQFVKGISQLFELPTNIIPVGMVAVGYPNEEKIIANRFNDIRVHKEKW